MSQLKTTRSTSAIHAVAQAAAAGAGLALAPSRKYRLIATLAGTVLRLFRSSERDNAAPGTSRVPGGNLVGSNARRSRRPMHPGIATANGGSHHG